MNLRLSSRWNALPTELETTQNLEGNVGFEPTEPFSPTVFKTAALDHYANSPCMEEGTGIEPETFQPEMFSKHSPKPFSITFLKIWCRPSVTIRIPSPLQGDALPFELGRHNLERHARFELAPSAWKAVMLTINTNIAHYLIVKEHKKKSLKFFAFRDFG